MQISIGSRLRKQRSRVERRTRRLIMEAYVGEEVVDGVDRGRRGGGGGGWSGEGCERALVGGGGRRIGVMEAGGVGVEGIRVREYIRRGIWSRAEAGIVGIIRRQRWRRRIGGRWRRRVVRGSGVVELGNRVRPRR